MPDQHHSMVTKSFLPHQHNDILFLTDSGMETQLVFLESNFVLREFSSFELLETNKGCDFLRNYYRRHAQLATTDGLGFVLESVLWRANPDWLTKLGYNSMDDLPRLCHQGMKMLQDIQDEFPTVPMVKSGTIGPRSDGYVATTLMSVEAAKNYHLPQIRAMKEAGADIVTAMTMNYIEEGLGVALAAQDIGVPVVLSFTVETNGCLRTGETLQDIIETVDGATNAYPAYYMINCAHPTHFLSNVANSTGAWKCRLGGIRSNASRQSHAELDECEEFDYGDPVEFGQENQQLLKVLPSVNVVGGCCGTDYRHVLEIKKAYLKASLFAAPEEKKESDA